MEPIAVVGVACRFPGGVTDTKSFWDLLRGGGDAITEVPPDRWNADRFHHPDPSVPGRIVSRWGGFVSNHDRFDAAFFGISPREASRMDPLQRWLAEVTWEALEDGGVPPERLAGTRTGVFVGISHSEYPSLIGDRFAIDRYVNSGSALSIAANRLSFLFDFRGPSLAVDTACSSSLVALHLAAQSLRSAECDFAIVGGANALLTPEASIGFSQARMLSPRGRCRAFDADADGYVRSEGAAAILLVPLPTAKSMGLHPRAVLVATAANQDGRSSSLTVPAQKAQEEMIVSALQQAGVEPNQVVYMEAHGTGTTVGDRIEVRSVASTLARHRHADHPLLIGSVKSNIGHLEPASGLAGFIKATLVLEHSAVPPNLHFQRPNPKLPLKSMKVPTELMALPSPREGRPHVAVNSFGFGGTNAHALLAAATNGDVKAATPPGEGVQILPLSARSAEALADVAQSAAEMIDRQEFRSAEEACAAFALGKSHHHVRRCFVAESLDSLSSELRRPQTSVPAVSSPPKIAFVFSGQGSQWWRMGRELYHREPVVRDIWEEIDSITRSLGGPSVLGSLLADETSSRLDYTEVAQCAIFALQAGLVRLWRSWGIDAHAVIGHSVGEAAAAWTSGTFDLESILRIVVSRSRLQERTRGSGRMLAAAISASEAEEWSRRLGGRIFVAAVNAPGQVTLSGRADDLDAVAAALAKKGVFCRQLSVPYAFHSDRMDAIEDELRRELSSVEGKPAHTAMFSTVSGAKVSGPAMNADYWWRNVRQPVLFASAVERALEDGCDIFLEIGPHPVMTSALSEIALRRGAQVAVLSSLRRELDERQTMLNSLASLYESGCDVRWDALYSRPSRRISLPAYPWHRQKLWADSSGASHEIRKPPAHPLLGDRHADPQPTWMNVLDSRLFPWLADHRVAGTVVVPAAAYLEMAVAAVREHLGEGPVVLEKIQFHLPLFLPEEQPVRTSVRLNPVDSSFQILSSSGDGTRWDVHAEGFFRRGRIGAPRRRDMAALREEFEGERSGEEVYRELQAMGQTYGPGFRGLQSLLLLGNERALGRVCDPARRDHDSYTAFPPLLDSCFHPAVALKDEHGRPDRAVFVASLERFRVFAPLPESVWSDVRITGRRQRSHTGDFTIYRDDGDVVAEARGLCVSQIEGPAAVERPDRNVFRWQWEKTPTLDSVRVAGDQDTVWIFGDRGGFGERASNRLRESGAEVSLIVRSTGESPGPVIQVDSEQSGWADRLFAELRNRGGLPSRILFLWSWSGEEELDGTSGRSCSALLDLVGVLETMPGDATPRVVVVTSQTQSVTRSDRTNLQHSEVWGFARTMQTEYPGWRLSIVDCESEELIDGLLAELFADEREPEVSLRADGRYVHRFVRARTEVEKSRTPRTPPPCYSLITDRVGRVDALSFAGRLRHAPGPREIEVEISAAGLNFRDLMKVLGIYPRVDGDSLTLGDEFSGTVCGVGSKVTTIKTGDRVMGFTPAGGAFASHVTVPADCVFKLPKGIRPATAAALPVAFGTAFHALHTLARLRKGETILIHAAAGGVGLAALQIAKKIGARILATAGSERKRAFLRGLGVELVMDSRSLDFADEVLEFTKGRGVDVVLNSLAGDFLQKSIDVCAPHGRFVEIGKRDIHQKSVLPLGAFQKSLAFFAFDLGAVLAVPGVARTALRRFLAGDVHDLTIELPVTTFTPSEVVDAFRTMQSAEHIGKLAISFGDTAPPPMSGEFWADSAGTYLLTGGTSGFTLAAAEWLVSRGARHLVLLSRRGKVAAADRPLLREMRRQGVSVSVVAADVTDPVAVAQIVNAIEGSEAPLRGVVHGAMILRDRPLREMTSEDLHAVLSVKVAGAWNLHKATRSCDLDCFVLFSSISAILGAPGQANYAAANSFLDALAHHRRGLGLPALSVNWGAISEVGSAAARPELLRYMKALGVEPMKPGEALPLLAKLIAEGEPQTSIADIDWQQLSRMGSRFSSSPVFRDLISDYAEESALPASAGAWRETVLGLSGDEQLVEARELIVNELAATLGMPAGEVDRHGPLAGLDSLMAVELKFRIENHAGCDLPIDAFNGNCTLDQLAERLLGQLTASRSQPQERVSAAARLEEPQLELAAPLLRKVPQPIAQLIEAGELNPLTAAAVMSWPDDLFSASGISPADFFERMNGSRVSFDLVLETPVGAVGIFMLPLLTSRVTPGETNLVPQVLEALRGAAVSGARCVALTGLIPSATGYGTAIRDLWEAEGETTAITTGHGTTIAAVVMNLQNLLRASERELEEEAVLFYGVGSIGLGALRLMLDVLPHPAELLLCDPYRDARFFDELTSTLRRDHGYSGRIRIVTSQQAALHDDFYEATVIVGATNVPNVLDAARLRPGTLIVDDSAPHCLNGPAALSRFVEAQDILCTEGGFVRASDPMPRIAYVPQSIAGDLPAELPQLLFSMLNPHDITACVLSAALSATRLDLPSTIGLVEPEVARRHWKALAELGFGASELNYEGTPLPRHLVERFRQNFGSSSDRIPAVSGG